MGYSTDAEYEQWQAFEKAECDRLLWKLNPLKGIEKVGCVCSLCWCR
jgi:hypothetical protein